MIDTRINWSKVWLEHNFYLIPDLEAHLDLLVSVGGNDIRCTMSSRDEGDVSAAGNKSMEVRWLDIRASHWAAKYAAPFPDQGWLPLSTPGEEGYWAVVITVL